MSSLPTPTTPRGLAQPPPPPFSQPCGYQPQGFSLATGSPIGPNYYEHSAAGRMVESILCNLIANLSRDVISFLAREIYHKLYGDPALQKRVQKQHLLIQLRDCSMTRTEDTKNLVLEALDDLQKLPNQEPYNEHVQRFQKCFK